MLTLKSGREIPQLGLGTWQLRDEECQNAVREALLMGYRHIDTAVGYGNHTKVGQGIAESRVKREDIFLTSKAPRQRLWQDRVKSDCDQALRDLKTDYLDLYLIHWPNPDIPLEDTLAALEYLREAGKVLDIGVSNFSEEWLGKALKKARVPIVNNQVEFHAYLYQQSLLAMCRRHGVVMTAHSPLARGRVLNDDTLKGIGANHGKSAVQVSLRWLIQKDVVAIPKATSVEHLKSNLAVFDFELSKEEMATIDAMDSGTRLIDPFPGVFE